MMNRKGFTLIEIIITIVVLSIAIGTLMTVSSSILSSSVTPEVLDRSSELAEQQLERISNLRFSQVVNEGPAPFTGNFTNYSYRIVVAPVPASIADDAAMARYKQVTITITQPGGSTVNLTTIVTSS